MVSWLLLTPPPAKSVSLFRGVSRKHNLISTKKLMPKDPLPNSSQGLTIPSVAIPSGASRLPS